MSRSERKRRLDEAWKTIGEDPKLKSRELAGLLAKSDTAIIAGLAKKDGRGAREACALDGEVLGGRFAGGVRRCGGLPDSLEYLVEGWP